MKLNHHGALELKMGKSCEEGMEIDRLVVESDAFFDDLSSKSSHESLDFGGHSSKKR